MNSSLSVQSKFFFKYQISKVSNFKSGISIWKEQQEFDISEMVIPETSP